MGLGRSRPHDPTAHPGEPAIGVDLAPPFTADDEPTRWLFALNRFGIRPGLERIEGLLSDLGHPERDLTTLVVAGTNGKGSTTRVLAHLLKAAGRRTATYTSPHLLKVHERILVDDEPVPAAEFAARVAAIRPLVEKRGASWFETLTALAVQIARDAGVDVFCCETGLGGRLDASNALPARATLLTTVDLDHQKILGETVAEIAAEKLGLLKRGTPLFCGVDAALRPQVFAAAVTAGSPCHFLDELARWDARPGDGRWRLALREREFAGLPDTGTPALRRNVALALLALSELDKAGDGPWLPSDPAAALRNLFLPGRYQTVLRRPDWIFDTAHNEQALREVLASFTDGECAGRRIVVFGSMADKCPRAEAVVGLAACDHVVGFPVSLPRARTTDELHELFTAWSLAPVAWPDGRDAILPRCGVAPDPATALAAVRAGLRPEDRVLVTGSCFVVAEVLHRLGFASLDETREPAPAPPASRSEGSPAHG